MSTEQPNDDEKGVLQHPIDDDDGVGDPVSVFVGNLPFTLENEWLADIIKQSTNGAIRTEIQLQENSKRSKGWG